MREVWHTESESVFRARIEQKQTRWRGFDRWRYVIDRKWSRLASWRDDRDWKRYRTGRWLLTRADAVAAAEWWLNQKERDNPKDEDYV